MRFAGRFVCPAKKSHCERCKADTVGQGISIYHKEDFTIMLTMKKRNAWIACGLSLLLAVTATACGNSGSTSSAEAVSSEAVSSETASSAAAASNTEALTIHVGALKGPTGLGMVQMMQESDSSQSGSTKYTFTTATAPDDMVAKLTSGEMDIAALPTNLVASLYQKTSGKVQMLAVNTLGMLSVMTNGETINSIADLKGKTVLASGKGAIPEYAFDYILQKNGLKVASSQDDAAGDADAVTVEYVTEHAEVAQKLISGEAKIAVLPQPFVTQVLQKSKTAKVALDVTDEWNKVTNNQSVLSMGSLAVRKEFAEQHKDALDAFLTTYQKSTDYTNQHPADAAKLAEQYLGIPAAVAEKAIPDCNITYLAGKEMKEKITPFFQVLFDANPKSIGGKMPDDAFYYGA